MMKAIMYHYVREPQSALPNFKFLSHLDFAKQLDFFESEFGFVTRTAFEGALETGKPTPGVILTFDDGLSDHYEYVFPELQKRGLWGIFYIPTYFYESGKMLDVHRTHYLLGKHDATEVLELAREHVTPEMLSVAQRAEFDALAYDTHDDSAATKAVKKMLNYFVKAEQRSQLIDAITKTLAPELETLGGRYYLTRAQMREMHLGGMLLGSHSVTHSVMSTLSDEKQRDEIERSFALLNTYGVLGEPRTFCYPYGGFHSFNETTEKVLSENGTRFSLNVEPRDIQTQDLRNRVQALPRYDCNVFPNGQIWQSEA